MNLGMTSAVDRSRKTMDADHFSYQQSFVQPCPQQGSFVCQLWQLNGRYDFVDLVVSFAFGTSLLSFTRWKLYKSSGIFWPCLKAVASVIAQQNLLAESGRISHLGFGHGLSENQVPQNWMKIKAWAFHRDRPHWYFKYRNIEKIMWTIFENCHFVGGFIPIFSS